VTFFVQVLEGKAQYIEMAGNLVPITKSGDQPSFTFHAFHENRLPLVVRVRDMTQAATGRIAFMSEARATRGDSPLAPTCTLNIALPENVCGWGSKTDDEEESEKLEHYGISSKNHG
jgi:ankyrin